MLTFRQSQSTAARRRWMFQLIGANVTNETPTGTINGSNKTFTLAYLPDPNTFVLTLNGQTLASAGVDFTLATQTITMINAPQVGDVFIAEYQVPALTGQTGAGYISKNGAAAVATTNSMVEVDATNMPGFYYIELTVGELSDTGFLGLRVKTAQSLNYEDKALITYDDPYAFHGGFPVGSGKGDMQKLNWKKLLEMMRQVVKEEVSAIEQTEDTSEAEKLDKILECVTELEQREQTETDLAPVLQAIADKQIPNPKDYTKDLVALGQQISKIPVLAVEGFNQAIKDFDGRIKIAKEDINTSMSQLKAVSDKFVELQKTMEQFEAMVLGQSDMDKRFDKLAQAANNKKIEELAKQIKDLQSYLMGAMRILVKV